MENEVHHTSDEPRKLSYELIKQITNNFNAERILGSGGFGTVYKGVYENGEEIAVKILRNMSGFDGKEFRKEFRNLRGLRHQNVVELVGFCDESKQVVAEFEGKLVIATQTHTALCFEYVHNGSLHNHITAQDKGLNWHERYKIIKGICEGLKYLREGHESPIMHLDLKPDNILLDKKMVPKIADFGLSRLFGEANTRITISSVGTFGYLPPEYIKHQVISKHFDIYSLGVIITRIMIGHEGYNRIADMPSENFVTHVHDNWRDKLTEILNPTQLEANCQQVKRCIEIALECMKQTRHERPTIQNIVSSLVDTETMIGELKLQIEQFSGGDGDSILLERVTPEVVQEKVIFEEVKVEVISEGEKEKENTSGGIPAGTSAGPSQFPENEKINASGDESKGIKLICDIFQWFFQWIQVQMQNMHTASRSWKIFDKYIDAMDQPFYLHFTKCTGGEGYTILPERVTPEVVQKKAILEEVKEEVISEGVIMETVQEKVIPEAVQGKVISEEQSVAILEGFQEIVIPETLQGIEISREDSIGLPSDMSYSKGSNLILLTKWPVDLPFHFLKEITDDFSIERILSKGAFGTLYKGIFEDYVIAVKKLTDNAPVPRDKVFTTEVQNIMALKHDNIVRLTNYCHEQRHKVLQNNGKYIVMDVVESLLCYEYLPKGSLDNYIFGRPHNIDWATRFKIIKGICSGLRFLHLIPIVHMDLKPENIMLDNEMVPKIANFGLSRILGQEQTWLHTQNVVGSHGYMAPEYLYRGEITTGTDIYSLGLVIIQITTGEKNNSGEKNEPTAAKFINKIREKWTPEHIASAYKNLSSTDLLQVKRCIDIGFDCAQLERKYRPSVEIIVEKLNGRA